MNRPNAQSRIALGDFQTPIELAAGCCEAARRQFGPMDTLVEPTCGKGAFVKAGLEAWRPDKIVAYEIQASYLNAASRQVSQRDRAKCEFHQRDFFAVDWHAQREKFGRRVLFLGNPPWVTNSQLGTIGSKNVPRKSNVDRLNGIDAMTGRSNFDIAESVLRTLLDAMRPDHDALAMLVKTATARKLLSQAWRRQIRFSHASLRPIDAKASFGVSVDACLLLIQPTASPRAAVVDLTSPAPADAQVCLQSTDIRSPADRVAFGWAEERLVADPQEADATRHLRGGGSTPWRSGVKHDLASVLELSQHDDGVLLTRAGDRVDVETDRVYPLAKGSDVANGRTGCPHRRLLVPQTEMRESTDSIAATLPKTIRYLRSHGAAFDARKSSIYRGRDRFAVFGIGPYTFAPWKVAICGLYKRLAFSIFGPIDGQPVVLDDTTYGLSFSSEAEATLARDLLESDIAGRFFQARVFWDAKRPITAELLRSIDLAAVANELGRGKEYQQVMSGSC